MPQQAEFTPEMAGIDGHRLYRSLKDRQSKRGNCTRPVAQGIDRDRSVKMPCFIQLDENQGKLEQNARHRPPCRSSAKQKRRGAGECEINADGNRYAVPQCQPVYPDRTLSRSAKLPAPFG